MEQDGAQSPGLLHGFLQGVKDIKFLDSLALKPEPGRGTHPEIGRSLRTAMLDAPPTIPTKQFAQGFCSLQFPDLPLLAAVYWHDVSLRLLDFPSRAART